MPEQIGVTYSPVRGIGGYHMALFYDKGEGSPPQVIEFKPSIPFQGSSRQLGWLLRDMLRPALAEAPGQANGLNSPFGSVAGRDREWRLVPANGDPADSSFDRETLMTGNDLSSIWMDARNTKDQINAGNFAYLPLSQNSNTSIGAILNRSKIPWPKGVFFDTGTDQARYNDTHGARGTLSLRQAEGAGNDDGDTFDPNAFPWQINQNDRGVGGNPSAGNVLRSSSGLPPHVAAGANYLAANGVPVTHRSMYLASVYGPQRVVDAINKGQVGSLPAALPDEQTQRQIRSWVQGWHGIGPMAAPANATPASGEMSGAADDGPDDWIVPSYGQQSLF